MDGGVFKFVGFSVNDHHLFDFQVMQQNTLLIYTYDMQITFDLNFIFESVSICTCGLKT